MFGSATSGVSDITLVTIRIGVGVTVPLLVMVARIGVAVEMRIGVAVGVNFGLKDNIFSQAPDTVDHVPVLSFTLHVALTAPSVV